jgi:hypothetical protein
MKRPVAVVLGIFVLSLGGVAWWWHQRQMEQERWLDQACLGAVLAGNANLITCPVHDMPATIAAVTRDLERDCGEGLGYACRELVMVRQLSAH